MRVAPWALALLLLSGCAGRVFTQYAIDPETKRAYAICRLWEQNTLMTGQTAAACTRPVNMAPEGDTVATALARGWVQEAKGGDTVGSEEGISGQRESEARVTQAGRVELPVAGQSGMAYASRVDDIGIETASVIRWFIAGWTFVKGLGSILDFAETDAELDAATKMHENEIELDKLHWEVMESSP